MASKLTKIYANFETQLAVKLAVGAVTGSLSSVVTKDGVTIASGKYTMVFNLGESNEEHLKFDLDAGTKTMTNIVSVNRAGTEVAGAQLEHRVGAVGKITNFVNLKAITDILNGHDTLDGANPIKYDAEPTISDRKQIPHAGYVQDVLSGAVGTANDQASGTTKVTKNQGTKPKARSVFVREQSTPDKTLLVESLRVSFIDKIIAYAGGNTPNFIDPGFGGDLAINTNPSNTETFVLTVDGTAITFTAVTSIGATPGNFLIGGSAAATRANLAALINNPTVTNANQVALTGAQLTACQKVNCTNDLALNIFIRATNPAVATFSAVENFAGAGNTWTPNTTKNRYDIVVIDNAGTLQIRKGTEAVSPTVPTPTTGDVVLCLVLNRTGMTTVRDYNVAGQGYITDWYDLTIYRTDLATQSQLPSLTESYPLGESFTGATTPQPAVILDDLVQPQFDTEVSFGAAASPQVACKIKPMNAVSIASLITTMWRSTDPGTNMSIEIQTDNAGVPSGTPVTNGTSNTIATSGMTVDQARYFTFTFATPPVLAANTVYHVVFKTSATNANQITIPAMSNANKYGNFSGASYNGSSWSANQLCPAFELVPSTGGGSKSLWLADANHASYMIQAADGFCVTTGSANATGTFYRSSVVGGFSSLSIGAEYFLSNTVGTITLNKNEGMFLGVAISATQLRVPVKKNKPIQAKYATVKQANETFLLWLTHPFYCHEDGVVIMHGFAGNYNSNAQLMEGWVMNTHANNTSPRSAGTKIGHFGNSSTTPGMYGTITVPVRKGDRIQFGQINTQGGAGSAGSVSAMYFQPSA